MNPLAAQTVSVPTADASLVGDLTIPDGARALVVFAHGSGSSRLSPRNRLVAGRLNEGGLGTLLFDLLTEEEERVDVVTRRLRFDIDLLGRRLVGAVDWLAAERVTAPLTIGTFGASTGAAAALIAAAERSGRVGAVVSRGGRPDLAARWLTAVRAPTLLIVGGEDRAVIDLNRQAMEGMSGAETRLEIVPGATHLFEEPGALERVAELALGWFRARLGADEDGAR